MEGTPVTELDRSKEDFQRRTGLLNDVGRRLLVRSNSGNQRAAEKLERALRDALDEIEQGERQHTGASQRQGTNATKGGRA